VQNSRKKPLPKTQVELSQETVTPYLNQGKVPFVDPQRRELQRTVKDDNVKQLQVGLQDIDEAIVYYFENVIRPSVIQNTVQLNVPVIYALPEKWASVQKDGYYRDRNGKIQLPVIVFKRDSIEKNRNLGNKMDANKPIHFGVFEKKYSSKNSYDRFTVLQNREPIKEYYGVIMPDYVDLTYTCIIQTEFVEQMNKIVESINYASDSYWGDPERFRFRAAIDSYSNVIEHTQGEDRAVKTSFQLKLNGYIIPDSINSSVANPNKYYSKSAVIFQTETVGSSEIFNNGGEKVLKRATTRFYDSPQVQPSIILGTGSTGMTTEQITYLGVNGTALADTITSNVATFTGKTILTPPDGFPSITESLFQVYINGVFIPVGNRQTLQNGLDIEVIFSNLGYSLESTDQIIILGKFN